MTNDTLIYALGLAISIIVWFLKGLVSKLSILEIKINSYEAKLGIMETNHTNLDRRFDEVKDAVKDLTIGINHLREEILKRQ